jgi:hypothetical protein
MTPNDRLPGLDPDLLTPEQARRLTMWRALTDLSRAQADGRLTLEQTRLLESLAESLRRLASQMTQLAHLGRQFADLLEAEQSAAGPGNVPES